MAFIGGHYHKKIWRYQSVKQDWKLQFKIPLRFPRGQWVNWICVCSQVINKGGITYKSHPFHRDCFTCTNCNKILAGEKFTSRDDAPYCADCFGELFAKKCCRCTRPITGKWSACSMCSIYWLIPDSRQIGHHCSDDGLLPIWHQAITWTNTDYCLLAPKEKNISEIWIKLL